MLRENIFGWKFTFPKNCPCSWKRCSMIEYFSQISESERSTPNFGTGFFEIILFFRRDFRVSFGSYSLFRQTIILADLNILQFWFVNQNHTKFIFFRVSGWLELRGWGEFVKLEIEFFTKKIIRRNHVRIDNIESQGCRSQTGY